MREYLRLYHLDNPKAIPFLRPFTFGLGFISHAYGYYDRG